MSHVRHEVVIVTGAASGIGRAVAKGLAKRARALVLIDLDANGLAQTESDTAPCGAETLVELANVTSSDNLGASIERASKMFGRVDTVISAAGIASAGKLVEMQERDWLEIINVNLVGTYLLAKHSIPYMISSDGGSFTAIASDAGVRGVAGYSAYCASKHAVIGLIKCMALEYARFGVRSNAICPGFVETPMAERLLRSASNEQREAYRMANPSGRFGRPEEIASVVAHLSDPEQSYVNGNIYTIDGGLTAGAG